MRKKSHISLAKYMVKNSDNPYLKKHRYSFYVGSILPDLKPSFLYRRHEMDATFPKVWKQMEQMMEEHRNNRVFTRKDLRKIGEMSHYLADYFTYPHNKIYPGSMKDHCLYEKMLKYHLRSYLKNQGAKQGEKTKKEDAQMLRDYITNRHRQYLNEEHSVMHDTSHIVDVTSRAIADILPTQEKEMSKKGNK